MEDLEGPRESLYLGIEEEKQDGLKLSAGSLSRLITGVIRTPLVLGAQGGKHAGRREAGSGPCRQAPPVAAR
jgi:hypothetical protein